MNVVFGVITSQHDVQFGRSLILHDCGGTSCGSILGALAGSNQLTSPLFAPLNHTIKPLAFGFQEVIMAELARRILRVGRSVKGAFVNRP